MHRSDNLAGVLQDLLDRWNAVAGEECPYKLMITRHNATVAQTRNAPYHRLGSAVGLPSTLFLNRADAVQFVVSIVGQSGGSASDLQLSVQTDGSLRPIVTVDELSSDDSESLDAAHKPDSASTLDVSQLAIMGTRIRRFRVLVQENVHVKAQLPAGQGLSAVAFHMHVGKPSLACALTRDPAATIMRDAIAESPLAGLVSSPSESMLIYSGCAPGLRLLFDIQASHKHFDLCSPAFPDEPCVSFGRVFQPVLLVADTATGAAHTYTGRYRFQIIAAGQSRHNMKAFSSSELSQYNAGTVAIWTSIDSPGTDVLQAGDEISWLCNFGSPCAVIWPTFGEVPDYFMQIRISTAEADDSSYCAHQADFVLRLHGVTPHAIVSALIAAGVLAAGGALLVLGFLPFRNRYVEYQNQIFELMEKDDDDD